MSWAVKRPVVALLVWLGLMVTLGVSATALGGKPNDSFALPGVQSTTAQNLLEKINPATSAAAPSGIVVWSPTQGSVNDEGNKAAATELLTAIAALPYVTCVEGPFGKNLGRSCPAPTPTNFPAALNRAIAEVVAKKLNIPPTEVGDVVTLINQLAPVAKADPAQLAAIAQSLPEIARLASAPKSTLDALAALTPQQLDVLVGLNLSDIERATQAIGGLAEFANLPPATLRALAQANPATLAAVAAALPQDVAGLEAFWADVKAAIARDPSIGTAIVAIAAKYGISVADLEQVVTLINDLAPIANEDPATLSALARALPDLATLAQQDKATIDELAKLTPADLSFLVGLTKQDIVNITRAFGGLAQFAELPPATLKALADADPAKLAQFASALPGGVGELEKLLAEAQQEIATLDRAAAAAQLAVSPISPDRRVAKATVIFDGDAVTSSVMGNRVGDVLSLVEKANGETLTVGASGSTFDNGPVGPDTSVAVGLLAALIILLITFGSLIAAGLPLVVAITGLAGGLMMLAVSERFVSIASFAPSLAVMIGLGVGIDYSLFVLSRFTQEVRGGREPKEAARIAVGTAGRAVLFAGCTVIIALLGMFVLGITFFNGLAVGAAVTVLMVMLAAVWMLPALLSLLGARSLRLRMPWARHPHAPDPERSRWASFGSLLQRRPLIPTMAALIVVLGLAWPAMKMQPGFPDDGSAAVGSPVRVGYDLLSEGFGPGVNGPFFVAVQTNGTQNFDDLARVISALEKTPGVASTLPSSEMMPLLRLDPKLFVDGVTSVIVQPASGPADEATGELLTRIRTTTTQQIVDESGADIYVGGSQAVAMDFTTVLSGALPLFLLVVIGFGFLALMILFRSLVIPLTAAITSLLSFGAALGVTVAVFQLGAANTLLGVSGTGPILPFLPIMVFAILFGLSMDYQVFLVTRMKERWDATGDNRDSVRMGLAGSGRVVVAAATIMTSVFLAFVPSSNGTIKMFGVALAAAVIVDAFIVRLILVPSVMSVCGRANWWLPQRLAKVLPTITLE